MFIAWYWIVLIALVAVGYYCHMKRYCRAFRQIEMPYSKRETNSFVALVKITARSRNRNSLSGSAMDERML